MGAISLAERHAIGHINSVLETLPAEMLERAVPLERNAGGDVNYHRMCLSLRQTINGDNLLENLTCSFDETILSEQVPPGALGGAQTPQKSHDHPPNPKQNSSVTFDLISLRSGDISRAAKLMVEDASNCKFGSLRLDHKLEPILMNGCTILVCTRRVASTPNGRVSLDQTYS